MGLPILLPALPVWAQQLAGILPLSALIDFIDVPMKLHIFQLTGTDAFWNWTITPMGARLLLAKREPLASCCLDEDGSSPPLYCIDGRYGDLYPSSHPRTLRLCLDGTKDSSQVQNRCAHLVDRSNRLQKLDIVHISGTRTKSKSSKAPTGVLSWYYGNMRYSLTATVGWTCWLGAVVVSFIAHLWLAGIFLVVVPLTGIVVSLLHGGKPRTLLSAEASKYHRLVVATNSLNGNNWTGYYGQSPTVNSVLNKPLYQSENYWRKTAENPLRLLLQLLIVAQWASAIGSCSLQDWNAYVIVMWVAFSIVISSYVYSPTSSVREWMKRGANFRMRRLTVTLSSRRAMLSTLLYLSPDREEASGTKWIDPILAPSDDRSRWEMALKKYIAAGDVADDVKKSYWWKFIVEGVEVGREIEVHLRKLDAVALSV